jgi:ribosomal protein S18 acetylase RimI-like enzyme
MDDRIRAAAREDAVAVAGLWTEAYVTFGVGGRALPYEPGDALEALRDSELYVWEEAEVIAGVVSLRPPGSRLLSVAAEGEAELSRLAVARDSRRRGIGRALAELCTRRAQSSGWAAIALWSRPAQVEAHRLYESIGYARLPERDSVDDAGQGRVVFRLRVAAGPGESR